MVKTRKINLDWRHVRKVFALLAILVATSSLMAGTYQAEENNPAQDVVLARAAEITGQLPDDLEFLNAATANYKALGEQAIAGKVYNPATGEMVRVFLDMEGNAIDRDLDAEELAAAIADGPIHEALQARLAGASPDEMIPVAFWVPANAPDPVMPEGFQDAAEVEAWKADLMATQEAALAAARAGFLSDLAAGGYAPDYVSPSSPAVLATLPAGEIQRLAARSDVVHVFLNEGQLEDAGVGIGDPTRTSRGYRTQKFYDMSGAAVQVGVLECCGEVYYNSLYQGHPYIQGINIDSEGVCPDESHPTAVTGFIRSGHTDLRGQAYNAHINFSTPCDGSVSGAITSLNWLSGSAGNYSALLNHSYGGDTNGIVGTFALDAEMDSNSRNSRNVNVVSAGNNCNGYGTGTCNVGSPGIAYNPITVGNLNDKQTWSWADDEMWISSSYDDPVSTHNDREKPELSAAGAQLDSTTTSAPWVGYVGSGTSYSAPIVTGAAAVLQEADSLLKTYPEELKAILMATAWNNVEGAFRLSDQDGTGGIDAWRAAQVAYTSTNGDSGHFYRYCTDPWPYDAASFAVAAGRQVRVVIAWPTNPDYADYANTPSSDFDLLVTGPGGFSGSSSSWDNTYEVVFFQAPASGLYTITVNKWRCNEPTTGTWVGWAWAIRP